MNRNLKQIIRYNRDALLASPKDLHAIFNIMFHTENNILCEGNDGFRTYRYTYGEMRQRVEKAAAGLYARIGATHQYIALEMDNCPEWIVAFWAILMSGNKPYLVNLRYPHTLTDAILKTLDIKYTLCLDESALTPTAIPIHEIAEADGTVPAEVFEDELAFSSSATSMNEVVCFYSGAQIAEQILNFKAIVKENPRIAKHYKGSLKQLAFLPFYHVFGLFAVYFWFTFFGRTLVFLRDYSADTILKTCRRHAVTHIFAVPMLWHTVEKQVLATVREQGEAKQKKFQTGLTLATRLQNIFPTFGPEIAKWLLREVTDRLFGRSVLFCINGGSYLRDSAMELFNGIGYSMHNGYGMSEIGITSVELRKKPKYRNQNSIGRPFTSVEYRLDEAGILWVRGASLCTRKLINGEEHRLEGWFNTCDNMKCEDDHYFILGRQGDMVIGENGENINPDMIEKLFHVGGAKMLSVLGLDGETGQELSMIVQVDRFATEAQIAQIKTEVYAINQTLSHTTAIRKFYFTFEELAPPTAVKVGRAGVLLKLENKEITLIPFEEFHLKAAKDGALSPLLEEIIAVIAKTLQCSPADISPTSHLFFDLGATSIQYFSVVAALAERFSLTDYEKNETTRYTPQEICEYIERHL